MAASKGFDGLLVITPEGRVRFHSGIGNLGTWAVIDVHRAGAEVLGVSWDQCDVVWGDTSKGHALHLCIWRQSDHARDDARGAYAVGMAAESD